MPQIRYRLATDTDAPRIISMVNAAFSIEDFLEGTRVDEARLAAMMEKGKILMGEDEDGNLLGSVYFELRGHRGYLGMLAVDPALQGRGLSRRIIDEVEDRLRAAGCDEVEIIVLNMRPDLLPIYRRFGFVETGTTEFKPSRTLKPSVECYGIIMAKKLISRLGRLGPFSNAREHEVARTKRLAALNAGPACTCFSVVVLFCLLFH